MYECILPDFNLQMRSHWLRLPRPPRPSDRSSARAQVICIFNGLCFEQFA